MAKKIFGVTIGDPLATGNYGKYMHDHVSKNGGRLFTVGNRKYGMNKSFLLKACLGDTQALTKAANMTYVGEQITKRASKIQAGLIKYLDGQKQYNSLVAAVGKKIGDVDLAVVRAGAQLSEANLKYQNGLDEIELQMNHNLNLIGKKHEYAMNAINTRAEIDEVIIQVEGDFKEQDIRNLLKLKDLDEQLRMHDVRADMALKYGDVIDLDILPQKNYTNRFLANTIDTITRLF